MGAGREYMSSGALVTAWERVVRLSVTTGFAYEELYCLSAIGFLRLLEWGAGL
jgi:hypothetical protein